MRAFPHAATPTPAAIANRERTSGAIQPRSTAYLRKNPAAGRQRSPPNDERPAWATPLRGVGGGGGWGRVGGGFGAPGEGGGGGGDSGGSTPGRFLSAGTATERNTPAAEPLAV